MYDIYPSRISSGSAIIARQDPVIYGAGQYAQALDVDQIASYENNGFIVIEDVFSSEEVAHLVEEVKSLTTDKDIATLQEAVTEPGSEEVRSVFRVHELSERIHMLSRDPRLLDIARQVLGSEVYIHQSRVNLKPGLKGKEFYWHSDFETWHTEDGMPTMRALSCSVLLTDNNECNGPLMLVPGSHTQFISCEGETPDKHYEASLKKQEFGVPDPISLKMLVDQGGIHAATARAGSVIFFDCNTMHASAGNLSPWARSNVFMVYNSTENLLQEPKYGLSERPEYLAARHNTKALAPLKEAVEA